MTRRVSVGPGGAQANRRSYGPAISAHGRYVAFFSYASNLVAGDTNGATDVFVRDRKTQVTRRVSVGAGGAQANSESFDPAISADGRYVAFYSEASNLVAGDTNDSTDVFVRDRKSAGDPAGVGRCGRRPGQRLTASTRRSPRDGRYVAFFSDASNLVAGDTNDITTCSCGTARPR